VAPLPGGDGGGSPPPPDASDVAPLDPEVTPVPPAATPAPAAPAPVPAEPSGPAATPQPVYSNTDDELPPSLLALAALLVLVALLGLLFVLAGRFGWAESQRRALREATFRAGGTWGDFADWIRLGR
jgi:hypothetical protein